MHQVRDGLKCVKHVPGSGVRTEVEVRLSNGKAVRSGYDGFEGKEGLGNFLNFWMPGWTTYLRLLFSSFSLSPTTLLLEPTYPLALALYPPTATPKQSHKSNYIATALLPSNLQPALFYCRLTCLTLSFFVQTRAPRFQQHSLL
jgi:hypothetical protein